MRPRQFVFAGGLNLSGAIIATKPGEATLLENYCVDPEGGYRRFSGYEPFDGHPEPQLATYELIPFVAGTQFGATLAAGQTIEGQESGAQAKVIDVDLQSGAWATNDASGHIVITRRSLSFDNAEHLQVGGNVVATTNGLLLPASEGDDKHDDWIERAAVQYRAIIGKPPGEGRILGAKVFNGRVYAFRNVVGNTSATMYESSAAGWVAKKTGLAPSGRYEFIVHNFMGGSSTKSMYGVSGTHKAFQWDGSTWTDITTGMSADTPNHIAEHDNMLVLSFPGGSVQNSPVGDPTAAWTLRTGANEWGVGDEVAALRSLPGKVLAVFCVGLTRLIYGNPGDGWEQRQHSSVAGAYPYSVQTVPLPGTVMAADDAGLQPIVTTQDMGDFSSSTVSQRVRQIFVKRRRRVVDSMVSKEQSAYRLIYDDGFMLGVTFRERKIAGYYTLRLPIQPRCSDSGEAVDGSEFLVVGTADGWVYRIDVGNSFAGTPIECLIRSAPDDCGTPRRKKHFGSLSLLLSSRRPLSMLIKTEIDYRLSEQDIAREVGPSGAVTANAWDVASWDDATFEIEDDRETVSYPKTRIEGVGEAVNFVLYHGGEIRPPFRLESGVYMLKERGVIR